MKYLTYIITAITFLTVAYSFGQQDPNYMFYRYNMNVINPAYVGAEGYTQFTSNFRSQWVNVEGAPETQSFSLGFPLGKNVGLGASLVNDQTFVERQTGIYVDFSYRLQLTKTLNLFLGLKAGGETYDVNTDGLVTFGFVQDPLLNNVNSRFNPNFGLGAYLKHERYFVSLSSPKILSNDRIRGEDGVASSSANKLHMYLSGGYDLYLSDDVTLKPSVMMRFVSGGDFSMDITAPFLLYDRFEVGVNYRTDNALGGYALVAAADWIDIGYAYENSFESSIADNSRGTHEIFLRFNFGRGDGYLR